MPLCNNPLWPCAMTGAVSCLAGFEGLAVVIHGSSGCYYYPASLLQTPVYGTHLLENDIIFGSEARFHEVVDELSKKFQAIAIVTTCVPAIVGEDIVSMLGGTEALIVDSAGFLGDFEAGFQAAIDTLHISTDPSITGVNVDGLSMFDPFYRGNAHETRRLLSSVGITPTILFCADKYRTIFKAAPFTLTTNPDFATKAGTRIGTLLGLQATEAAFRNLEKHFPENDMDPVYHEVKRTEERIIQACDKFIRRQDPPNVMIFSNYSYAHFAAETLDHYLNANILFIGSRTNVHPSQYPTRKVLLFEEIRQLIKEMEPDLVIGSTYEQSVCDKAAFSAITPPIRGKFLLHARPIVGTEGVLNFIEDVLNTCRDYKKLR